MIKKITVFLAFLAFFPLVLAADAKGDEIMQKMYGLKKSTDSKMQATMTLIDKSGNKKNRKLVIYTQDNGESRNTFMEFLEPADVKGTRFLTIGGKDGDDQRLWLPALKKVRKIAASGKDGKFMGSDLTYYDMEEKHFGDASYTYLKDEAFEGKNCSVVEMVSKKADAPYSKSIAWVSKEDSLAYKMELYDKSGDLVKTIVNVEVKSFNGVLVPTKMVADNKKEGTKTLLQMDDVSINTGLKAEIFSVKYLER